MTDLAAALLSITMRIADLQRPRISESVTVVSSLPSIATPMAVTTLDRAALDATPSATIDDALRTIPGFSLFRRSSSRVANPTTQGASLRGLAASGSSRALVLADNVPLNDPVGGWVYWNRLPSAALEDVSVARGAAGDLFGADAVGGVVTLRSAAHRGSRFLADAGSHSTGRVSAFAGTDAGNAIMFGAAEASATGGFITVAPESRGSVDTPASSRHGSMHAGASIRKGRLGTTLRASHFLESRGNGTLVQENSTRVTQGSGLFTTSLRAGLGLDGGAHASSQKYRQSFSAVLQGRSAERPTSEQEVDARRFGVATRLSWFSGLGKTLTTQLAGTLVDADLSDASFTDAGGRQPASVISVRQLTLAVSSHASARRGRLAAGAGARVEFWRSRQNVSNEHVFVNPRLWATFAPRTGISFSTALQSGYRGPTINELYRPFRVGNIITQANALLKPESVLGVESGAAWHRHRFTLRALGFWSSVDDAVVNTTLSSEADVIVRQRQNASRIRAAGAEIEIEARLSTRFTITGSSTYTDSVFTDGALDGRRVPQVPRTHHAVGARGSIASLRVSGEWRYLAHQFDDDRNAFRLEPSSMADARVGWIVKRGIELFGAVENLLDEEQEVGRTPLRTIGLPRTSRVGVRVTF